MEHGTGETLRVAVVAPDPHARQALIDALRVAPDVDVVAWADAIDQLVTLGTRAHVCLCATEPGRAARTRLRERGCVVVTAPAGTDPVTLVRAATTLDTGAGGRVVRPRLAARQREVLVAYVTGSSLLPTVARELDMGPETLKTHLRRIRAKYAEVGRPAPTRHDLYVRAVEDGLVPPPSGRH
ncbi:MAG: response regulator transcription factor [Blastococcus sp.]